MPQLLEQNIKRKWKTGLVWLGSIIISFFFCFMTRRSSIFARNLVTQISTQVQNLAQDNDTHGQSNDLLLNSSSVKSEERSSLAKFAIAQPLMMRLLLPPPLTKSQLWKIAAALFKLKQNFQRCCCCRSFYIIFSLSNIMLQPFWMGPWNIILIHKIINLQLRVQKNP